jgi:hypothetical protein
MKFIRILMIGLIFTGFNTVFAQDGNNQAVYELRTYTTNNGKLDDLNARFSNHTIGFFNKYGMESIGYWIPVDKPNTLIYIIKHKSMAAAKQSWQNFINDPAWKIVAEETNKNGPILAATPESVYMTETDYSLKLMK